MQPAVRTDLAGTWRASAEQNELAPWGSADNPQLVGDTFFRFSDQGELEYIGLLTPDGKVGLWQVDFRARQASRVFRIARSGVTFGHAANISAGVTDWADGARIDYALRADDGFGVIGFDLTWTLSDIRVSPDKTLLAGTFVQTERDLASPVPATTRFGGTIELRKVDAVLQEPAAAISPRARLSAHEGGKSPFPTGTVFDLDATETTGPAGLVFHWTAQQFQFDSLGRFINASVLSLPDGAVSSFTARAAGTYVIRCWVTDGVQWVTDFPLTARVE